jgi:hypothetical protein
MQKFGITIFIDKKPNNFEFMAGDWPLHITVIDSFETSMDKKELIRALKDCLSKFKINSTHIISFDNFGPNKDIPVARVELTRDLRLIHNSIVGILESEKTNFKIPFLLKENYRPHITMDNSFKFEVGKEIAIKSISLIDKNHTEIRKVEDNFKLKK